MAPQMTRRWLGWLGAIVALCVATAIAYGSAYGSQAQPTNARAQTQSKPSPAAKPVPQARFIAVAGGATPDSNPISLEQNLALAHAVLPGPGVLLFGSGPGGSTVQVLDPTLPRDELLDALGALFSPRLGRDSRYQSTSLPAQTATATSVRTELSIALARPGPPLLLYMSGHGDQADLARDNRVQLWGGDGLSAVDLALLHEQSKARRELRVVITSCYSGGFAELAFVAADDDRGFTKKTRCALLATTWDLESSGCDPNPNRAAQEGYSLHMLNALRGMDRDGHTPIDADYDDDGKVTLLEAHTRARIAAQSIDVPTTTSERFLREHVEAIEAGETEPLHSPEEDTVIATLSQTLALATEDAARAALKQIEDAIDAADQRMTQAQDDHDDAYNTLAMELLQRWPVIDDPWHPLFATTLQAERDAILGALSESEAAQRYARTEDELHARDHELQTLETRYALHARLTRAYDNRHLAASLQGLGGAAFRQYEQLVACERGLP